ncbi:hypothetical protein NAEX_00607 [Nannocystis exedens]|nr:hypothetical protein [Nannocystis exedens]PCC67600.1 hypothetical protein NAEX_00607 [Nannocystis exedens]
MAFWTAAGLPAGSALTGGGPGPSVVAPGSAGGAGGGSGSEVAEAVRGSTVEGAVGGRGSAEVGSIGAGTGGGGTGGGGQAARGGGDGRPGLGVAARGLDGDAGGLGRRQAVGAQAEEHEQAEAEQEDAEQRGADGEGEPAGVVGDGEERAARGGRVGAGVEADTCPGGQVAEVGGDGLGGRVTRGRIVGEGAAQDGLKARWHGGQGELGRVVAAEAHRRQLAGEELVHERAEGVDVDAVVGREAAVELGGDVAGGAEQGAGLGQRGVVAPRGAADDLGQAEVEDLDVVGVVVAGEAEAVGRLDVAVDDAVLVRGREGAGDLLADVDDPLPGERPLARDGGGEVLAFEPLHDEEGGAAVGLAEVGDLDDVGVGDDGGGAGLLNEALGDAGVVAEARLDDLHGDGSIEQEMGAGVDGPHAAGAEAAIDAVTAGEDAPEQRVGGVGAAGDAGGDVRRGITRRAGLRGAGAVDVVARHAASIKVWTAAPARPVGARKRPLPEAPKWPILRRWRGAGRRRWRARWR